MYRHKPFAELRQTPARQLYRLRVTVKRDHAVVGRSPQNQLAMPSQPERRVNEQPAASGVKNLKRLPGHHRAMEFHKFNRHEEETSNCPISFRRLLKGEPSNTEPRQRFRILI